MSKPKVKSAPKLAVAPAEFIVFPEGVKETRLSVKTLDEAVEAANQLCRDYCDDTSVKIAQVLNSRTVRYDEIFNVVHSI